VHEGVFVRVCVQRYIERGVCAVLVWPQLSVYLFDTQQNTFLILFDFAQCPVEGTCESTWHSRPLFLVRLPYLRLEDSQIEDFTSSLSKWMQF
jgi:hypothetical protein